MAKCRNGRCGAEIPDDAYFCPFCRRPTPRANANEFIVDLVPRGDRNTVRSTPTPLDPDWYEVPVAPRVGSAVRICRVCGLPGPSRYGPDPAFGASSQTNPHEGECEGKWTDLAQDFHDRKPLWEKRGWQVRS